MKRIRNIILYFVLSITIFTSCSNDKYKDYIIEHSEEIYESDKANKLYKIDTCEYNYYTDVTIKLLDDSTYMVVFWGDRNSYLWDWKLDKVFTVDISYNNYKGIDVDKDRKIMKLIR